MLRPKFWSGIHGWRTSRSAAGVTHVVTTADRDVTSTRLELVYADASYRLYQVKMK
jgi:hypothetical protein